MLNIVRNEDSSISIVYPDGRRRTTDDVGAIIGYELLERIQKLEQLASAFGGVKISNGGEVEKAKAPESQKEETGEK